MSRLVGGVGFAHQFTSKSIGDIISRRVSLVASGWVVLVAFNSLLDSPCRGDLRLSQR